MVSQNITAFNEKGDDIFEFYVDVITITGKKETYYITDWEVVEMGSSDL
jgi:hypothetical protein